MEEIEDLLLAPGARFKHFILSYFKVSPLFSMYATETFAKAQVNNNDTKDWVSK